jgi:signal transduction histidine kinase
VAISFRIKLLASHAAVAAAVGAVALLVVERSVSQKMESQIDRRLEAQGQAVSRWLDRSGHKDRLAGRLAGVVGARVTIFDADDRPIGDSLGPNPGDAGEPTPEVAAARESGLGHATRFSKLAGAQVRYVAVPAPERSVVRLGLPIGEIDETKGDIRRQLGAGAVASLIVAFVLAVLVAAALSRRLRAAGDLAARIGAGDYNVGSGEDSDDEVGVLSRTLTRAAGELRETEARRREFLANVAHEIRTPVTSIRGYAETLENTDVDADTRSEFVGTIHRNAVRIAELVDDLLELEALQAGEAPALDAERVELGRVIADVIDTVGARAADTGATVIDKSDEGIAAIGDADAIERIVLNLADNALRHGGDGVRVEIEARRRGDRVVIAVIDDGPGIPAEQRARIFERFYRVGGDKRGSGLGLAISRELAIAMGGTLLLADAARTTFVLELPG